MDLPLYLAQHFEKGIFGNSWQSWIASASLTAAIFLIAYVLRGFLGSRLRKLAKIRLGTCWYEAALEALDRTKFLFILVLALHFGTQGLDLPLKLEKLRDYVFFFVLFYQVGIWLTSALQFYGDATVRASLATEPGKATTFSSLLMVGNIAIWVTMLLLLLANYGVNISALVAGLGIGGVAVAFALQNILADLFASFSIVFDKPFVIGDAISVNGVGGVVEHIGLKTTRIRSNDGEQLIFSNSDLLKNVVKNFKRMERRRVLFTFGLIYETPPPALNRAREIVQEIINSQKFVTFDRCHLVNLAASSLDFEVAFWIESSDFNLFADTRHKILVTLLERFAKEGLEFAYPHQVHVEKKVPAHA